MAKLMVMIDIPNTSYERLRKEVIEERWEHDWFSVEDEEKVLVDEAYLTRSKSDDSFFAFKLIGVRP